MYRIKSENRYTGRIETVRHNDKIEKFLFRKSAQKEVSRLNDGALGVIYKFTLVKC